MSDTSFGSTFSSGGGPSPGQGADVPLDPRTSPVDASPSTPAASTGGGFGSGFSGVLGGPNYTPPDPKASVLDQSADTLQQRIQRANQIASNPLLSFFNPEGVQAARNFVPQAQEQLLKIRTQQAQITANQQQAANLGLHPGEVSDFATQADRVEVAKQRALGGDLKVFQGLQTVDPKAAESIQDQVHEVVSGHLTKAQFAFDKLSNMRNQGEYAAAVSSLRKDGTLTDLETLGLKVPDSFDDFNAAKSREGAALRQARIGADSIRQKLEERNTYQPMEEKEAKTYNGRMTTAYGDQITNGTWSRNASSGVRGFVVNGAADPRDLGSKFTFATPEQRAAIKQEFDAAVPKEDMEKYRAFNRTYQLATTDAKGNAMGDGKINTNPNVQQGIAEGLASMLRGGSGGANVGLLKIELAKRGWAQGAIDGLVSNYAGTLNTLFGNANKPYLSEATQKQIRDVMDVLHTYNESNISDRVSQVAQRAGALGLDSAALGFGKNESSGVVADAIKQGHDAQVARMMPQHQSIGGGDGVFQLGAQRPGAGATGVPSGQTNTTQLPGAKPLQTPVQQAQNPQNVPPASGPPAGGGPNNNPPAPPTAGPTPGRYGLPSGMQLNTPQAVDAAANRTMQIESGFKPGQTTGSYRGLGQWSDDEMKRHGITNPDDIEQNRAALKADITARAQKLQQAGLPATPANVYLMHQQGEAGLMAHLQNPNGVAWQNVRQYYKSDAIAKQAIWGNMTPEMRRQFPGGVDSVTSGAFTKAWDGRYNGTDNTGSGSIVAAADRREGLAASGRTSPRAEPQAEERPGFWSRMSDLVTGRQPGESAEDAYKRNSAATNATITNTAAEGAPSVLGTGGAVVGGMVAGPPGAVVGGASGGGAGQALKDYLQGRPQDPKKIAEEAALSGVLSVGSAARPVLSAGARALGAGAVEAGAEAARGGSAEDVTEAGLKGTGLAAGGEFFGRALGMVGHKIWSLFSPDAKQAVRTAAEKYASATETLKTEQPKLPGANGANTDNPKYAAAEADKAQAETVLKDAGLKPEEAAYAHKVASEGVPRQEAAAARPGELEKQDIGRGYQQIESEVQQRGVGAPKASPKLTDGPIAAVANKQVSADHTELAERVEAAITAPAANWQDKWTQLKDARSALLQAERDALTSTATGRTQTAKDMRTLADTVRTQQENAAKYVFGDKDGAEVMQRLKVLDTRYQRLMDATNNGDIAKAAALTGEAGREAEKKFMAFAHDDPQAQAAYRAIRGAKGDVYEKTVPWTVAAEGIPGVGKVVKAVKMASMLREWARERTAGSPSTFADYMQQNFKDGTGRLSRDVVGGLGARAATMQ